MEQEEFRGEVKIVDIKSVFPNDWNPKESVDKSGENKRKYEEIKENLKKKKQYFPILVRESEKEKYEIIDGYHRWKALGELGYTKILVWNLGEIGREEAEGITLDTLYLRVPESEVMIAKVIKELEESGVNLNDILPYDDNMIEEYLKMSDFNWDDLDRPPSSSGGGNANTPAGKIDPKDEPNLNIRVSQNQYEVIFQAVQKARGDDASMSEGRALELICADYLAGVDSEVVE